MAILNPSEGGPGEWPSVVISLAMRLRDANDPTERQRLLLESIEESGLDGPKLNEAMYFLSQWVGTHYPGVL